MQLKYDMPAGGVASPIHCNCAMDHKVWPDC